MPNMKQEKRMGVLDHLEEFRLRLIIALVAILVTTALAYVFSDAIIFSCARPPATSNFKRSARWMVFDSLSRRVVRRHCTCHASVDLSAVALYRTALMPGERRFIVPGAIAMVVIFLLGNAFRHAMLHNMMSVLFTMFGSELNICPAQISTFPLSFIFSSPPASPLNCRLSCSSSCVWAFSSPILCASNAKSLGLLFSFLRS